MLTAKLFVFHYCLEFLKNTFVSKIVLQCKLCNLHNGTSKSCSSYFRLHLATKLTSLWLPVSQSRMHFMHLGYQ